MNKTFRRFLLYAFIAAFFLMICIWIFAGRITKNYLTAWMIKQGAETAAIESITINPFALSIEMLDLKFQKSGHPLTGLKKVYVNFSLFGLFNKELRISKADIQGINLDIHQKKDGVEIGGFPIPAPAGKGPENQEEEQDSFEWKVRLTLGSISDGSVRIVTPELDSRIVIEKFFTWETLLSQHVFDGAFKFSGGINDSPVLLDSTFKLVDGNGTASCKVSFKNLELGDFQKFLPDTVSHLTGKLSIISKFTADMNQDRIELSQKGKGSLAFLKVESKPFMAANDTSEFQTNVLIILEEGEFSSARVHAEFAGEEFQLQDQESGFTLVKWKEVSARKIEILFKEYLDLSIASIEASGLLASAPSVETEGTAPLLLAENLSVNNIAIQDMDTSIGSITIADMESSVNLNKEKKIVNLPELSKGGRSEDQTPDEKTVEADSNGGKEPPGIQIGLFEITGNSRFHFTDDSIDPGFKESFTINTMEIKNLDNKKPDQESPFILIAGMKEYGKLEVSGVIKPFAPKRYLKVNKKIAGYPLPFVSAYSRNVIGYDIQSGQMNAETSLEIAGDNLSGKTHLGIYAIKLTPHGADTAGKITRQVTMPLNVAVESLSDKDGNFELEIPISGSLDDPKFGLSHFFQTILTNAVTSAAYGAIRTAILPYGALVQYGSDAAIYDGEELVKLKLDPVVYKAGKVLPEIQHDKYIEQLSELMQKEKEIRIILCGFAIPADVNAADKGSADSEERNRMLLSIAEKRAEVFKKILVEKHNVSSERILKCPPAIDRDDGARPRLEIEL